MMVHWQRHMPGRQGGFVAFHDAPAHHLADPQDDETDVLAHHGIIRRHRAAPALAFQPGFVGDDFMDHRQLAENNWIEIGHTRRQKRFSPLVPPVSFIGAAIAGSRWNDIVTHALTSPLNVGFAVAAVVSALVVSRLHQR